MIAYQRLVQASHRVVPDWSQNSIARKEHKAVGLTDSGDDSGRLRRAGECCTEWRGRKGDVGNSCAMAAVCPAAAAERQW